MCGIAGHWSTSRNRQSADLRDSVEAMCQSIAHRGPDAHGVYEDPELPIVLGHQRLSVLDLASGSQPMSDTTSNYWLVFNGEIYNYRALRKKLRALGYQFKTQSDAETIIYAYLEWGERCVEYLDGMFAFALWDRLQQQLFCARDRLGIKPFYYYFAGGEFAFCSELKGLVANAEIKLAVNYSVLGEFLTAGYVANQQTSISATRRMPPGHTLTLKDGKVELNCYWSIASAANTKSALSFEQASEELKHILGSAVENQLVSDVPIGAFLSGGIDSSAVVALMAEAMEGPVLTHCVGFNARNMDERGYAADVAKHIGTDHRDFLVDIDVGAALDNIVWHMDEPFADASAIPTYYLCQAARQRVTVCLSGDGGDELFGGYNWHEQLARFSRFDDIAPQWFRSSMRGLFSAIPYQYSGATFLRNIGQLPMSRHMQLTSRFSEAHIRNVIAGGVLEADLTIRHPLAEGYRNVPSNWGAVKRAQLADMQSYMVEGILMKVDKMSMASSLEVRVPMLDHRLVEFAFSQPTSYNVVAGNRKRLLKSSISRMLPDSTLARKKQGFSVPLRDWLLGDLRERVGDLLLSAERSHSGIFKTSEVEKLWRQFVKVGFHIDLSHHIWTLLCYEMWHQQYSRRMQ